MPILNSMREYFQEIVNRKDHKFEAYDDWSTKASGFKDLNDNETFLIRVGTLRGYYKIPRFQESHSDYIKQYIEDVLLARSGVLPKSKETKESGWSRREIILSNGTKVVELSRK